MKKSIGFVSLDSSLAKWLAETLRTAAPRTAAAEELRQGLGDLLDGGADSLMLELADGQAQPRPDGVIRCGALSIDPRQRRVCRDGGVRYSVLPGAQPRGSVHKGADLPGCVGKRLSSGRQQHHGVHPQASQEDRAQSGCAGIHSHHLGHRL